MKRLLIIMLCLLSVCITGCKSKEKEKVNLEDIYGKYYYKECIYLSEQNIFNKESLDDTYKDVARYSLKENSFAFYQSESLTPTISLKNINYKEVELDYKISIKEPKEILKDCSTRFDIFREDVSQGYSFAFDGDKVYFIEFRSYGDNNYTVWNIFLLEKRD
ncbi:MAG: hypothetical protein IJB21_06845 [Bacilli bacterium]|nr:hypothetical protein [Bacilli bacterium]